MASDAVSLIAQGKVQLVVNTPRGLGPRADGQHIRAAAVAYKVPCLTTLAAARAAAAGMADTRHHPLQVRPLQDLHPVPGGAGAVNSRRRPDGGGPLATQVGAVELPNPVMTASGTSGHGTELGEYGDLSELGAVVVKSLSVEPWPGNPAPRVHEVGAGMLNSVGLQGPGLAAWLARDLPALRAAGARVVVSIWGRTVADYARAAELVAAAAAAGAIVALEVNVSCPNVEDRSRMFAHSADATSRVMAATECGVPRWAKLSPNVPDVVEIASGALDGGADGLTLVNTLLGLALDMESGRPVLGGGGGGLSGAPLHPVAVRAVWECRGAFPEVPIVGVGGVMTGRDAAELLLAGADAVQVGTATFRDPRAPWKVLRQLARWCDAARDDGRRHPGARPPTRRRRTGRGLRRLAGRGTGHVRTIATRGRPRWLTASVTGWPRRCAPPDRSARASTRRRRCSGTGACATTPEVCAPSAASAWMRSRGPSR